MGSIRAESTKKLWHIALFYANCRGFYYHLSLQNHSHRKLTFPCDKLAVSVQFFRYVFDAVRAQPMPLPFHSNVKGSLHKTASLFNAAGLQFTP